MRLRLVTFLLTLVVTFSANAPAKAVDPATCAMIFMAEYYLGRFIDSATGADGKVDIEKLKSEIAEFRQTNAIKDEKLVERIESLAISVERCASKEDLQAVKKEFQTSLDSLAKQVNDLAYRLEKQEVRSQDIIDGTSYEKVPSHFLTRGTTFMSEGKHERALACFAVAIDLAPMSKDGYLARASLFKTLELDAAAIIDYSKALEIDPKDKTALTERGMLSEKEGQYQQAISDLTALLEIEPRNTLAMHHRGRAFLSLGSYELAVNNYRKLISIDEKHWKAWNNLGVALQYSNEHARAISAFDQGLVLLSDIPSEKSTHSDMLYRNRAKSKYALSSYASALEDCNNISSPDVEVYAIRGLTASKIAGFPKDSNAIYIADLDKAIDLGSSDPWVHIERAAIARDLGDLDKSLACAQKAITLDSTNAFAHYELGYSRLHYHHYSESIESFDRSLELFPADTHKSYLALTRLLRGKARMNWEGGDGEKARSDLYAAIKLESELEKGVGVVNSITAGYVKITNNTNKNIVIWINGFIDQHGRESSFNVINQTYYEFSPDKSNFINHGGKPLVASQFNASITIAGSPSNSKRYKWTASKGEPVFEITIKEDDLP